MKLHVVIKDSIFYCSSYQSMEFCYVFLVVNVYINFTKYCISQKIAWSRDMLKRGCGKNEATNFEEGGLS